MQEAFKTIKQAPDSVLSQPDIQYIINTLEKYKYTSTCILFGNTDRDIKIGLDQTSFIGGIKTSLKAYKELKAYFSNKHFQATSTDAFNYNGNREITHKDLYNEIISKGVRIYG